MKFSDLEHGVKFGHDGGVYMRTEEITLEDVAQANVEKLRSRFERGVIRGEGDVR